MKRDHVMRRVLVVAAIFNLVAASVVLFPDSIGRFADLPRAESRFYSWMVSLFILLFGGVYAWLSRRPVIDRPLVVLAAVGKMGVFLVAFTCLLLGELSATAFAPAVGDMLFGLCFLWWLGGVPHE